MSKVRQKLAALGADERHTFAGTFVRTGFKSYRNHYSPTLLLRNITLDEQLLTDHLWLNYGKNFLKLGKLHVGDIVQFNGRVGTYVKGYFPTRQVDYRIMNPTKVTLRKVSHAFQAIPTQNKDLIGMILSDNADFYQNAGRGTVDDDYYLQCFYDWQAQQN